MNDPESPIRDPSQFVGQAGTVRRIYSRIGADRPQSVAVIGGLKTGKTSLLTYLSHDSTRDRLLEGPERYLFVSACAACESAQGPDEFILDLHRSLAPAREAAANGYESLRRRIDELHSAGKRIVIFMDDFHAITSNKSYPLEFFSFLRSLANNFDLAYVTTSFLELQKLCVIKDVEESPFFNIFTNLSLAMLSPEEAVTLARTCVTTGEADARCLAEWCGGAPYVIKKAAAALAGLEPSKLSEKDMEASLLPHVGPYFTRVISLLPSSAARPLQAVARGKNPGAHDIHLLGSLVKQGFLLERGDGLVSHSPAFAAFLRASFDPRMLKGTE
jgi:serine/threonine-protein kinase